MAESKYGLLQDHECDEHDIEDVAEGRRATNYHSQSRFARLTEHISLRSVFITVMIVLLSNFLTAGILLRTLLSDKSLQRRTSAYSPVLNRVEIPFIDYQIESSLVPNASNPAHIYRLPPSPAVDEAWDRITNVGIHSITREDVERVRKDPTTSLRPPPDWGFNGNYMAEIDVFHQLHCLNSLRKGLIHNYQYYWGERYGLEPPLMFETHLNHCMDVLRQNIMCHSDVEVITYDWRETQLHPFPNFGINKKCRDFNAVLEWQERTKLQDARRHWYAFKKPEDAVQLPPPEGLKGLGKGTGWHKGDGFHLDVPTQQISSLPHGLEECSAAKPANAP